MRAATVFAVGGLIATLLAAGTLTFVDTYSGETCEVTSGGTARCTDESSTLIEENGRWVLGLLTVPVVLAGGMLASTIYRLPVQVEWLLAGALLAVCLLAIFSVGFLFLPAAALLIAAAATEQRGART